MLEQSTLGGVLANFLIGSAVLVVVGVLLWLSPVPWLPTVPEILSFATSNPGLIGAVVAALALLTGFSVEAMGHLLVDTLVFGRSSIADCIDEPARQKIQSRFGRVSDRDLSAAFMVHASEHVFNYRSEQWYYYELYRNGFVGLVGLAWIGAVLLAAGRGCVWATLWYLATNLAAGISLTVAYLAVRYYHGLTGSFVAEKVRSES